MNLFLTTKETGIPEENRRVTKNWDCLELTPVTIIIEVAGAIIEHLRRSDSLSLKPRPFGVLDDVTEKKKYALHWKWNPDKQRQM